MVSISIVIRWKLYFSFQAAFNATVRLEYNHSIHSIVCVQMIVANDEGIASSSIFWKCVCFSSSHYHVLNKNNDAHISDPHFVCRSKQITILLIDRHHTENCTSLLFPSFNDRWFVEYFIRRTKRRALNAFISDLVTIFCFCVRYACSYFTKRYVK